MGTMTILFVDQVGSTRQLSTVGDHTAVEIRDELHAEMAIHLREYDGVFHSDTGDGFMASFDSSVNAVECALSLHEAMIDLNATHPLERRMVLRMGLHTGEPLIGPSGPFGAAVVVAARLCELAGAEQVLVSDVVRVMLEPRRCFEIVAVGPRRLKGFPDPVICHLIRRLSRPESGSRLPPELASARDAPFIGRGVELDRLRTAFIEAAEGTATTVLVTGPNGAGKTRLVQEFAAEVHQQGARVAYGGDDSGRDVIVAELGRARADEDATPVVAVIEDVSERKTIVEVVDALRACRGARILAVIVTELGDLSADTAGSVVVQLAELRSDQMAGTSSVGAVNDQLQAAIHEATAVRAEEQRSMAAVTSGLLALAGGRESPSARHPSAGDVAPYKGLLAYGAADGRWFCGRDALTAELVAKLAVSRFVAVTGSSGSGKSSLVHAGLVSALATGAIKGSASWPIITLTPHGAPLTELARTLVEYGRGESAEVLADRLRVRPALLSDVAARLLDDHAPGSRLIVIVDQFEEVFTLCHREEDRVAFFDALVGAAQVPDGPTTVVIAVRGDYYGHCSMHQDLARLVAANHLLVGPMSPSEIRTAIEDPAHRAGVAIDAELVDRVVDDASGEAGVLPLLSTAMLETWHRRRGSRLTLDAYVSSGGVHGAIARLAETVYEQLSPDQRSALRSTLLRLAELGEDGDDVRRRAPLDELVTSAAHQEVLDVLVSHRLVTVDAGRVEVAHEALLREWPRLRTWLEEDRAGRALHRRLTSDARAWDDAGRGDDTLLRGLRLDAASEWAVAHETELHPLEQAYLDASAAARQREVASSRRSTRRRRALAIGLAVLLLVAAGAGVIAQAQRNQARSRARVAEATRITNLSELAIDQDLSLGALLAIEAWRTHENRDTEGSLLAARERYGTSEDVVPMPASTTFDVSSRDLIAGGEFGEEVTLWDLRRREEVGTVRTEAFGLGFSPDGDRLGVFTIVGSGDEQLEVWDVASQQRLSTVPLPKWQDDDGIGDALSTRLAWTPDGSTGVLASGGGTVVFDAATGEIVAELSAGKVALITRTGDLLAVFDGARVGLWDPNTLEERGELEVPATDDSALFFSLRQGPDDTLMLASETGELHLWDLSTRQPIEVDAMRGTFALQVSPNGEKAVVDGTVWDLTTWRPEALIGQTPYGFVPGRFTSDGSAFIVPVSSGMLIHPTAPSADRAPIGRFESVPVQVVFGRLGQLAILGRSDEFETMSTSFEAALVDPARRRVVTSTALGEGRSALLNRGGTVAAVQAESDGDVTVRLFDVLHDRALGAVRIDGGALEDPNPMALSDDGGYVAISGIDGQVQVARTDSGAEVTSLTIEGDGPVAVAFSPDGDLVTVRAVSADGRDGWTISTWAIAGTRRQGPSTLAGTTSVASAQVSGDGQTLLVNSGESVNVVSLDRMEVLGRLPGTVSSDYFAITDAGPDRVLAPAPEVGGHQLWDLTARLPVGKPLQPFYGAAAVIVEDDRPILYNFSAPGGTLFMTRQTLDPDELVATLCEQAGRNLTPAEWEQYFPNDEYRTTCEPADS